MKKDTKFSIVDGPDAEYASEYSERNGENIKRLFMQKAEAKTIRRPRIRLIAIAAVLCVIFAASAYAATSAGGIRILFDDFLGRATVQKYEQETYVINEDGKEPLNITVLSAQYTLEFSKYDELSELFTVKIGNEYMENFIKGTGIDKGWGTWAETNPDGIVERNFSYASDEPGKGGLRVIAQDDVPFWAEITAYFIINDEFADDALCFETRITIPLDGINYTPPEYKAPYPFVAPSEYSYTSEKNGIETQIFFIMENETIPSANVIELRFEHNGVYYELRGRYIWAESCSESPFDEAALYEIAVAIIDAF